MVQTTRRVRHALAIMSMVVSAAGDALLTSAGSATVSATDIDTVGAADLGSIPWSQVGDDIDGEADGDRSGSSVAASGDGSTVIVGAIYNDGNGLRSGHARVHRWDGDGWSQIGGDLDGEDAGDQFGSSVAISSDGSTVIVGGSYNDGNGVRSGHSRVFRWTDDSWMQVGDDIDGEAGDDWSGQSVAMSGDGNTVVIGAPRNGANGRFSGQARVHRFDGTAWTQVGGDIDGEAAGDWSGQSVAMSDDGNIVVIGAPRNSGNGELSGQARVYRLDGGDWVQVGGDIDGEAAGDLSGSVAMSSDGDVVVVGAIFNAGNGLRSGHARVLRLDGGDWVQVGGDIDGSAAEDQSGLSVAMSSDGDTVVVGAAYNDGNGDASGQARVFHLEHGSWVQAGADIYGEGADNNSGWAVAMSSDGNTITVAAPDNGGNGRDSGHVRVYRLDSPTGPPMLACGDIAGTADELAALGYNVVTGTDDDDFLRGTPGNDIIFGLGGRDVILAGMGDDVVCAGANHDVVVGGDGADRLHGEGGNDRVWGGNHDDLVTGGNGEDLLVGGNGDDDVSGDNADDTIRGGNHDDVLRGGAGKDDIRGDAGNDTLFGGSADDVLRGHGGIDLCDGGDHVHGDEAFGCETLTDFP